LFPKRIADLVTKFQIEELNLKLTQGNWRYDLWSAPILSAPSGAELSASFRNDLQANMCDKFFLKFSHLMF
jgi:hypothetical protein